jgi:hypothetical protein
MTKDSDPYALKAAKLSVFLSSLIIGAGVGVAVGGVVGPPFFGIICGIVVALVNPFVAAQGAAWCEALKRAAFPRTYSTWSPAWRAFHGAAWPFAVAYWCIVSVFYISINRAFRELDKTPALPPMPMFEIEVAQVEPTPKLLIKDIAMTHPGCGGGAVDLGYREQSLECRRCHLFFSLHPGESSVGAICRTALDGKPRTLVASTVPKGYSGVVVRQKARTQAAQGPQEYGARRGGTAYPGTSSGRLPSFQAIMDCERNYFEERLEPAAKRR